MEPVQLRKILFEGNTPILLGLNRVHQSKEQVSIARGNLLPSINLGSMLSFASSGSFSLSSIEFLLPFLLPSRWFDYYQMKNMFEADKMALHVLKVNQYASALSLYQTILGDQKVLRILNEEVRDLSEIADYVEKSHQIGIATQEDLHIAKGQAGLARINLSKAMNLVATEKASLRHALGLSVDTVFTLLDSEIPTSEWEDRNLSLAKDEAWVRSLEGKQMQFLADAAHEGTWSKIFGFISGSSFRSFSTPTTDATAFSNITLNQTVGIGFAYFPSIRLSQMSEEAIRLRQREVGLEIGEILERIFMTLSETKKRLADAEKVETDYYEAYLGKLQQYKLGLVELNPVLQTRVFYRTASIEVLNAKVQVMLSRIVLHRAMLSDGFSEIQGCSPQVNKAANGVLVQ